MNSHSCALSTLDELKCWGSNEFGQLGLGDAANRGDGSNEMGDDLQDVAFSFTMFPTLEPAVVTTDVPSSNPTDLPTSNPTKSPSTDPSAEPTALPTALPTDE